MAGEAWPRSLIHKLTEGEFTSSQALAEFRAAGGKMRTQTWYRMWGEVENERSLSGIETGRPLHLKPTQDEVIPMTTRRASGYMQRVQVVTRDSEGTLATKTIDVRSKDLISRKNAIGRAEKIVEGITTSQDKGAEQYYHAVVTAFYGGTYELNPE